MAGEFFCEKLKEEYAHLDFRDYTTILIFGKYRKLWNQYAKLWVGFNKLRTPGNSTESLELV